ncbi:MAG: ABC transporter permease [Vicinamibacterales bacterium]
MSIDGLAQNLRYAVRALRRDLGFTVFAVLIAALGIGASTTVFSVVDALLLRPLPFAESGRLVWISNHDLPGLSGQTTQVGHMIDLAGQSESLESLAGYFAFYGVGDAVLTGRGEPERLSSVPVSGNFFEVLGVRPELGRTFTAEEATFNGPKAVLLSHALWERRFASDPAIVGAPLTINAEPYTVAGVLPASFDFGAVFAPGRRFDLFTAFPLSPETNRWGNTMAMIGRLKPGVTAAGAQAEVQLLASQFMAANPDRNSFEGFVTPLADHVSGGLRLALWVLVAAVGVVMLIVCANLSNLLLARTAGREKEMAIRAALGAGRRALVAQMLTEGLVLAGAGALLGVGLAVTATRALSRLDGMRIPLLDRVQVDATALGVTLAIAVVTGLVFGLAPAMQASDRRLHDALKDQSRGSSEGRRRGRIRNGLVVAEIAFACVLLVGAGLLIRSLVLVLDVDLGFQPARAATIRVDPIRQDLAQDDRAAYFDEVLRLARGIPRVEAAAITDALPLGRNRTWGIQAKDRTYERGTFESVYVRIVSDGYAAAMGVPVKAGRDITDRDTAATDPVIVINETMARTVWPGQDPVGQVIVRACGRENWRVVGVVGDVRHLALEAASGNEMYLPMRQCGDLASANLVMRSALPPATLAGAVRQALRPVAPELAANEFRPLDTIVDASVSSRRFVVSLLGGFAAFALVLASLGIFALISYSVNRRTPEIGIRMALGASAGSVQAGIIRETLTLAATGMAIGAAASWWLARSMQGLLYGVTSTDPVTFAGMAATLALVAAVAGYLPARRAARIDPLEALRVE